MSASSPAANQLVDVNDPPIPSRKTPITRLSFTENLKLTLGLLAAGIGLSALAYFLWHYMILVSVGSGIIGLLCLIGAFSPKGRKAGCPFCGSKIDGINENQLGKEIRCEKCGEYSAIAPGMLQPVQPGAASEQPKYDSPVFRNASWPNGCVVCGETPTRLDDLSKTTVGGVQALLGHLQVMRGSVSGIPYCDNHRDGLGLNITSEKKMFLRWKSLRMMRRYLAANRNRATY